MDKEQKEMQETTQKPVQDSGTQETQQDAEQSAGSGSMFEGIYERLPDIPVKALDCFIIICIIAFVAVVLVGVLKAKHIL